MIYQPFTPFKVCSQCQTEYPASPKHFARMRRKPDGLRPYCKKCQATYYQKTRDKTLARAAERYADPEVKRKKREYDVEYYAIPKNGHKMRSRSAKTRDDHKGDPAFRQKTNAAIAAWRKANPEKHCANQQRRRARELQLPATFTSEDWDKAIAHFKGCCAVCGRPPGLWHYLAMDHWIPISDPTCPGTIPENIVPLCHGEGGCNNSKSNRDPLEWLMLMFGERKARRKLAEIQAYFDSLKKSDE